MPAPHRITRAVLVLVPLEGVAFAEAIGYAKAACRHAFLHGYEPICPLLRCALWMTDEEVWRQLGPETEKWARRCARLWLCGGEDSVLDLDGATYDVLLQNEGALRRYRKRHDDPTRMPVYRFWYREGGEAKVALLARKEITSLLRCNIMSGLFKGAAA